MVDPGCAAAPGPPSDVDGHREFESEATARLAEAVKHMRRRACWYEHMRRIMLTLVTLLAAANVLCAAGRMQLREPWCLRDELSAAVGLGGRVAELSQDLVGSDLR